MYQKINEDLQTKKEKVTSKANENCEPLPKITEKVFVKNKTKRGIGIKPKL